MLCSAPTLLAAQVPGDTTGVLILEHRFSSPADSTLVELRKGVMYWADLDGPGTPAIRAARRYGQSALVVDADVPGSAVHRFEIHAGQSGPHRVHLPGLPAGQEVTLRLYRDEAETRRFAESRDRDFAIGLVFGGGGHTGYRLEPAPGDPQGGRLFEGGIVTQSGSWFSAVLGLSRHSLHNPDFAVAWFFLEPRARVASWLLGRARTDLAVTLRVAAAPESGPHHLPPNLLAPGLTVTYHLARDGRRRGPSIYTSWRHGWIGNVPETDRNTTDEFTLGLSWIP
jgi:hypothetical protein